MRKEVDKKSVMLPMLKMFCVFTLNFLLHPVVEVKILHLTGVEGFLLENYSCCSSLNIFMFEKFHYASVRKILARYLAENSEKSVCCGFTQGCSDLILSMITSKLHKKVCLSGTFLLTRYRGENKLIWMQCRQKWNLRVSGYVCAEVNARSVMSKRVGQWISKHICRRVGLGACVEDEV